MMRWIKTNIDKDKDKDKDNIENRYKKITQKMGSDDHHDESRNTSYNKTTRLMKKREKRMSATIFILRLAPVKCIFDNTHRL